MVNTVFASAVFCNVPNEVVIRNIKNTGTDTAYNITVAVYDDAISATKPVATTTIPSIAGGKAVSMTKLVDPTLREYEGGTVTYRAVLDPDNLIQETNKDNNEKSSFAKPLKYNGYMGASTGPARRRSGPTGPMTCMGTSLTPSATVPTGQAASEVAGPSTR